MQNDVVRIALAKREELQKEIDQLTEFLHTSRELLKELDSGGDEFIVDSAEHIPEIGRCDSAKQPFAHETPTVTKNETRPETDKKRELAKAYVRDVMLRNQGVLNQMRQNLTQSGAMVGSLTIAAE